MIRATTPTFTFRFPQQISVTDIEEVVLTFKQAGIKKLVKYLDDLTVDVEKNAFELELSQTDTKAFIADEDCEIDMRPMIDGKVYHTEIVYTDVKRVLNDEVITIS